MTTKMMKLVARPGDARPRGWLLDRARAARDGFTGHMDDVVRLTWAMASSASCLCRSGG